MLVPHGTLIVPNQMLCGRPEFLRGNGWIYLVACTQPPYILPLRHIT
jgi:hypothetical protein